MYLVQISTSCCRGPEVAYDVSKIIIPKPMTVRSTGEDRKEPSKPDKKTMCNLIKKHSMFLCCSTDI